jgi:predicted nucleic acid-binding protein
MSRFVDTSAWYAAADSSDRSNAVVKDALSADGDLVTSDHVLVESWILLRHRLGRQAAERFWEVLRSGAAAIEPVGLADLQVAWTVGEAFPDQDFSIVDRTSFAVMHRLGIDQVVTLDADFAIYRFGRRRERAFRTLP